MNQETFIKSCQDYISSILRADRKYFMFDIDIEYSLIFDDDLSFVARWNKGTNHIDININAIQEAADNDELHLIEYYLLMEIRHIYQYLSLINKIDRSNIYFERDVLKELKHDFDNPINRSDEDEYFSQISVVDAYSFALAVMKIKYDDERLILPIPNCYLRKDFSNMVNHLVEYLEDREFEFS